MLVASVVAIVLRFKVWLKDVFFNDQEAFVNIEKAIQKYRDPKSEFGEDISKDVYRQINRTYEKIECGLNELLKRKNYVKNQLKTMNEFVQLALTITVTLVFSVAFIKLDRADYSWILLESIFISVILGLSFITVIIKPNYQATNEFYEYELYLIEEKIVQIQRSIK